NTGNSANITVTAGYVRSNDLSTNVGFGAFGTLGSGAITLSGGGGLAYDGPTATSAKPLTLTTSAVIQVVNAGANLTMNGVIGQSAPGASLIVFGSGTPATPSTLTLMANNSYSGPTNVSFNAVLAIPTISNAGGGGTNSPLGASSNAAASLQLGGSGRGDLLLTATSGASGTDRGATLQGLYSAGGGGGI